MNRSKAHRLTTLAPAAMLPVTTNRTKRASSMGVRPLDGSSHVLAEPHAFGNAAVLRVVKACIGDLQPLDRGLDRRKYRLEARRTDGLRISQPSHMRGNQIVFQHSRI